MTDIRRAHQCHKTDCDSEARWRLGLHIECIGIGRDRIRLESPTTLLLCDNKKHHKAAIEYVMSERNKSAIVSGILANGLPPPDWSSVAAVFVPIDPFEVMPDKSRGA